MSAVYQEIELYDKSVLDLSLSIANPSGKFKVSLGVAESTFDNLESEIFSISGQNGYIFDQNENFIGGYKPSVSFNISIHNHGEGNHFSTFIEDCIISNNITSNLFNYLKFEKETDSDELFLQIRGQDILDLSNNIFLKDSTGILLYSSDNILLQASTL